jgi:hypothetical protein
MSPRAERKDLVEVFGYEPDDISPDARTLREMGACPFIGTSCSKMNHDKTVIYGTCSVTSPDGDCIICPNRLYADDLDTLRRVAGEVYGADTPFLRFPDYVARRTEDGPFVVALGMGSGREVSLGKSMSMDWVLAKVEHGSLLEYVGIEVQSIDTTGNYRDTWHAYHSLPNWNGPIPSSEHGLNWANVHKRLMPQLLRKGTVYSRSALVRRGIYFILPEVVYRKFEDILGADIPPANREGPDVMTVHTYELGPAQGHGRQRSLDMVRRVSFTLEEFADRFVKGPNLPPGADMDSAVRRVLGLQ